jgi:hypothetical protein
MILVKCPGFCRNENGQPIKIWQHKSTHCCCWNAFAFIQLFKCNYGTLAVANLVISPWTSKEKKSFLFGYDRGFQPLTIETLLRIFQFRASFHSERLKRATIESIKLKQGEIEFISNVERIHHMRIFIKINCKWNKNRNNFQENVLNLCGRFN